MVNTAAPRRAFIGMSVEQAASFIRSSWDRYQRNKDIPLHPRKDSREVDLRHYSASHFREDLRDCGWCLGHSGGTRAMSQAHDLAIKGLRWNDQGHDLSRAIDHAFCGIAGWMA
jgi:hypothetical protein